MGSEPMADANDRFTDQKVLIRSPRAAGEAGGGMTGDPMVIGSWGVFETRMPAEECGRLLNSDRSAASYVGYADGSGFELSPSTGWPVSPEDT
jgi:hypothetical protein